MGFTPWSDPAARPQLFAAGALAALAAVGAQLTAEQAHAVAGPAPVALGLVVLVALGARSALARAGAWGRGWPVDAVMAATLAFAFVPAPDLTGVSGGAGVEYRLLAGLRNLALVGAVFGDRPRAARTAVGSALAVMLFAFSLGKGWPVFLTATLFAAVGVAWLALGHWREFAAHLPADAPRRPPLGRVALLGLIGGLSFVAGVLLYPAGTRGWLEQMVAPETAEQPELAAARQTLQDANRKEVEELAAAKYGAPASAAAGATGQTGTADGKSGAPDGKLPAGAQQKTFPLARALQPADAADPDRALFQLQERGPRHVPLVSYDQFDGAAWRDFSPPFARRQVSTEVGADRSWVEEIEPLEFSLAGGSGPGGAGPAAEDVRDALDQLALASRGGGRVVAPKLKSVNRDRVLRQLSRAGEGEGAPDYLVTPYDREQIRRRLANDPDLGPRAAAEFDTSREFRDAVIRKVLADRGASAGLPPEVGKLVEEWTADRPRGWPQIDALVQGLRRHARHDPAAVVAPTDPDPLRSFLVEERRGTDFMFATAAAVLLRHLGYPTRLVGGFYARPDEYSRLTGTTAVRAGDVHYWTQVQTPDGGWVNVEPTPGYEPAAPVYTARERAERAAGDVWRAVRRYWPVGLAVGLAVVSGWAFRRRIAERLATVWWHLRAGRAADRLVPSTWRLLDRRAAVAGAARRPGTTLAAFADRVTAAAPEPGDRLAALAALTDRLTHAPGTPAERFDRSESEVRTACRRAVRDWTVAAFRRAAATP